MRISRLLALGALCPMLAACWQSADPLMLGYSDLPVALGRTFRYQLSENGDEGFEYYRIDRDENGRYILSRSNEPYSDATSRTWVTFDHLYDGWYIIQQAEVPSDHAAATTSDYRLLAVFDDGSLDEWDFGGCSDAEAARPGVSANDVDCGFDNYESLRSAAYDRATDADDYDIEPGNYEGSYVPI